MRKASVLVVGAGIIGVCSALALRRAGFSITLADPEPPGAMASYGNAGAIAVTEVMPLSAPGLVWRLPRWLLDPLGPLSIRWRHLPALLPWLWRFSCCTRGAEIERISRALAALMGTAMADFRPLLGAAGIAHTLVENGALTVYRDAGAFARDAVEWETKRARGVRFEVVDAGEIARLEPALGRDFGCGVFAPDWSHVLDPYEVVSAVAALFEREGGQKLAARVADFEFRDGHPVAARASTGERIGFDQVVVAAGVWSKALARRLGSRVLLACERGYNTTLPAPGVTIHREVIFAQDKFVMTPMRMGLRIGGAAEFAGIDAAADYRRCKALLTLARRHVPGLDARGGTEWMGQRPSCPDSLPVIGRSPHHPNVLYAFGHGHLGLTQAATTGRLVATLARGAQPDIDLRPFRIDRF